MPIRKLSYMNSKLISKKVITVVLMFTMISLFAAGCGRKTGSIETKARPTLKESSQKEQLPQNTTNSTQDKNKGENVSTNNTASTTNNSSSASTAKSSDTSAATNTKLQQVSDQMDKLGSALDGLDNSSEISTTESIINNIN